MAVAKAVAQNSSDHPGDVGGMKRNMIRRTHSGTLTFEDFLELVHEDEKADLIDGVIYYMASPENIGHNKLIGWLYKLISSYVEEKGLGEVTFSRVAYRLSDRTGPEPDVAFVRTERLGLLKETYVDGPPDLAVEIVSPESIERDYEDKRLRYEEAGVEEYWIIDPKERAATFLVRTPDSGFAEALLECTIFRSHVLPGFDLDVRWLWRSPLPAVPPIVPSMLAAALKKGNER